MTRSYKDVGEGIRPRPRLRQNKSQTENQVETGSTFIGDSILNSIASGCVLST